MKSAKAVHIVRWVARLWSVISLVVLLAFGIGEAAGDIARLALRDALGFLFFPIGVIIGLALAWRREQAGGLLTVGCLAGFYVQNTILRDRWPAGPWFLLLAAPGFLFLLAWALDRRQLPSQGRIRS
ncbi:MAG: hypothetical protein N2204_05850 [Anaerolineae bacterium]|nr:hypothetical protein [Anaerolineae bacterium]